MAAAALAQNANLLTSLLGSTRTTKGGSSTQQTMLSADAVNALLKDLLGNEQLGLSRVASGARGPGLYNSSTQQLLVNDLLARSAAQVAKISAPTVTTKSPETVTTPGLLSGNTGLAMLALGLGTEKGRKALGLDSLLEDVFGGGGSDSSFGDALLSQATAEYNSLTSDVGAGGSADIVGDLIGGLTSGSGGDVDLGGWVSGIGTAIRDAVSSVTSGCFITTAVCSTFGRPDNCYELEMLRQFRDTWMREFKPRDIEQYYAEAPGIVEKINSMEDAAKIYHLLDRDYIQRALKALDSNLPEAAYLIYKDMFKFAKEIANG
jgi:hypothetical protein